MARTKKKGGMRKRKSHAKRRTQNKIPRVKNRSTRRNRKAVGKHKRSLKKSQKGGDVLAAAGVGLAMSAIGAVIYSGLRLLSRVNDKSIALRIINSPLGIVRWLPKVQTVESNEFSKQYLQCITETEFMKIIFTHKFLKSRTLMLALLNVHSNDKEKKNKDFFRQLSQLYQHRFDEMNSLKVNEAFLETSDNPHFIDLKSLLLPTATYAGLVRRDVEIDNDDVINSRIAVQYTDIIRVIYGLDTYDDGFNDAVNSILKDRKADMIFQGEILQNVNH